MLKKAHENYRELVWMLAKTDGYAYVAARKALRDYLRRNNLSGEVLDGDSVGRYRIQKKK